MTSTKLIKYLNLECCYNKKNMPIHLKNTSSYYHDLLVHYTKKANLKDNLHDSKTITQSDQSLIKYKLSPTSINFIQSFLLDNLRNNQH